MQSWVPGQRGEKVHPNCQPTMSEMGSCGGRSGGPEVCHGRDAARTVTGHLTGTAPPSGCRHHSLPPCGLAAHSALGSAATLASLQGKPSDQAGSGESIPLRCVYQKLHVFAMPPGAQHLAEAQ